MTKLYFQFILLFIICFLAGCSSNQDSTTFSDAKKTDTLEAYNNYLSKFPRGQYKKTAMQRIFTIEIETALNDFIKYTKKFETTHGSPKKAPSGVNYMSESNRLISLSGKYSQQGMYNFIFDNPNIDEANKVLSKLSGEMRDWRKLVTNVLNKLSNMKKITPKERKEFYETINTTTLLWCDVLYPKMKKQFIKIENNIQIFEKDYKNKQLSELNIEYTDTTFNKAQNVDKISIENEMKAFRKECDNIGSHFMQLGNRKLVDLDLNDALTQLNKYAVNIDSWPAKTQQSAKQVINRIDEIVKMDIQDKNKLVVYSGDVAILIRDFFNDTKYLSDKQP